MKRVKEVVTNNSMGKFINGSNQTFKILMSLKSTTDNISDHVKVRGTYEPCVIQKFINVLLIYLLNLLSR